MNRIPSPSRLSSPVPKPHFLVLLMHWFLSGFFFLFKQTRFQGHIYDRSASLGAVLLFAFTHHVLLWCHLLVFFCLLFFKRGIVILNIYDIATEFCHLHLGGPRTCVLTTHATVKRALPTLVQLSPLTSMGILHIAEHTGSRRHQ